jgi:hypothetical protein
MLHCSKNVVSLTKTLTVGLQYPIGLTTGTSMPVGTSRYRPVQLSNLILKLFFCEAPVSSTVWIIDRCYVRKSSVSKLKTTEPDGLDPYSNLRRDIISSGLEFFMTNNGTYMVYSTVYATAFLITLHASTPMGHLQVISVTRHLLLNYNARFTHSYNHKLLRRQFLYHY